jgi:two-component system cell cycle sensor histidine kinase/response regulator CckA
MNKYSVGIKLGTAFGLLVSLLVGVGWLGLSRMGRTNADLNQLMGRYVAKVQLAQDAEYYGNRNVTLVMQILILNRKEDINVFMSHRAENRNRIADIIKTLEPKIDSEKERELLIGIENTRIPTRDAVDRVFNLLNQGRREEARKLMADVVFPLLEKYQEGWRAFVRFQKDQMEWAQNLSEASYLQTRKIAGALMFIAIALATVIAGFSTHRIMRDDKQREETKTEIRKLNEELESKVTERTEDLARAVQELEREIIVRRRREEDLQRSKTELATAQRIAHLGSFQLDLTNLDDIESNSLHWSDELFRIFGYEPGQIEVSRAKFLQAVHPDDRDELRRATRNAIQSRQSYNYEYRIILPDTTERTIHGQLDIVCDQTTGQPLRMVGTVQDITERKKAEERFYKAFNVNPEPMTIATISEGRYIDVNESFLRITGHELDEVIGRTSLELKLWNRHEDRTRLIDMLEQQGSVRDSEMAFCTKSGELRAGLISAEVIEIAGQKCILSIVKDVTKHQFLEKQLRQSQKMEAIGQLSGGIAHDFNNLLGVIIGYSEILEQDLDSNSKMCRHAKEIKKAGQRAASLTRQLLAFSRQQVLEAKVLSLNTVVTDTEKMLRRLIGEDIEMSTALDPDLGQVKADQGQIEMVIMNLAVNARDAMPNGGRLSIETRNIELDEEYALRHPPTGSGNYVMLIMTDTGIGMDAQTQAHIFEPFFTTKEVGKGTGLGLATVYGVVKQSGGYIWVYSEPGLGSTFKIYLPRVDEAVHRSRPSDLATGSLPRSETILLVEDEESLRTLTRTLLEESGYTVLEANGGSRAIEIVRQHRGPIHLLLTDMVMPGMNGREVAEKLMPMCPGMRVIYMSGYAGFTPRGVLNFKAIFLPKPFTRDALVSKLREVLSLQKESTVT